MRRLLKIRIAHGHIQHETSMEECLQNGTRVTRPVVVAGRVELMAGACLHNFTKPRVQPAARQKRLQFGGYYPGDRNPEVAR